MSITQTGSTWSFTLGAQTYTGYPTREAAAEALYDAERGKAPDLTGAVLEYIAGAEQPDLVDAVLEYVSLPADIPLDDAEREIIDTIDRISQQRSAEQEIIDTAAEAAKRRAEAQRQIEDRVIRMAIEILTERKSAKPADDYNPWDDILSA